MTNEQRAHIENTVDLIDAKRRKLEENQKKSIKRVLNLRILEDIKQQTDNICKYYQKEEILQ